MIFLVFWKNIKMQNEVMKVQEEHDNKI